MMKRIGLAALLLLPLGAQDSWPALPADFWKLDTSKARDGVLLDSRIIRLSARRREDTFRFRLLPGAVPSADLDVPGSGPMLGRFHPPEGAPVTLGSRAFQPGAQPGTRRPSSLPGEGFLDLQVRELAPPLGLLDSAGQRAMAWFPLPQLHQRIPLGGRQTLRSTILVVGPRTGFTAFEGSVDGKVKQEVSDGAAFMTVLQDVPPTDSPQALALHWFDLPFALGGLPLADTKDFWLRAQALLRKTFLEDPSGGLLWPRKRKPFLESLPTEPEQAAQAILDRIGTRLTFVDVNLEDTLEQPELHQDLPEPDRLGEALDKGVVTPPGRFHLAHRLFADAGLKPQLKFLVDPAQGTLRTEIPSIFQITHVLLGVPRADGTLAWFDPRTLAVAPAPLAQAPGLRVASEGWRLISPTPIP